MTLERELIVRAQRGESEAQEALVSQLAPMVFRLASRFFRTREDVEDLAQEAFSRFFLKIDQIRPDDNVAGWVSRVTINVCYDRLRKLQRERAGMERYGAEPARPNRPEVDAYEHVRTAVDNLDAKLILISFNSEGFITKESMLRLLERSGRVETISTQYNTFRGSRNLGGRDRYVTEFLYLLEKF